MNAALAAVAAAAVLVAGAGAGGYAYGTHHATPAARTTVSPTPTSPAPTTPPATQSPTPTPTPTSCFDTAQTQLAMNDCAGAEATKAAATLAKVLTEAHRRLDGPEEAALDRAQRAWLAYRGTYCASLTGGGTIDPTNVALCWSDLDTRRARDVCTFLSPNGGDETPTCAALVDER
jgi:uncharacterized protein YecT (DUF1311 family)